MWSYNQTTTQERDTHLHAKKNISSKSIPLKESIFQSLYENKYPFIRQGYIFHALVPEPWYHSILHPEIGRREENPVPIDIAIFLCSLQTYDLSWCINVVHKGSTTPPIPPSIEPKQMNGHWVSIEWLADDHQVSAIVTQQTRLTSDTQWAINT